MITDAKTLRLHELIRDLNRTKEVGSLKVFAIDKEDKKAFAVELVYVNDDTHGKFIGLCLGDEVKP